MPGLVPAGHVVATCEAEKVWRALADPQVVTMSKALMVVDVNGRDKAGRDGVGALISGRRQGAALEGGK
jgi:hypothetical protein